MNIINIFAGFFVSTVLGALVIWLVVENWLWQKCDTKKDSNTARLSLILGILERISYTSAMLIGQPEWIGVWLVLKISSQWGVWKDERYKYNIFLIGNLLSVMFGVLGWLIAISDISFLSW